MDTPDTGQLNRYRDVLTAELAVVVIIATQSRVMDIVIEMRREGIRYRDVLIEHDGRLGIPSPASIPTADGSGIRPQPLRALPDEYSSKGS